VNLPFLTVEKHTGDTPMCQLLHSEGCPWSQEACYSAAQRGHLQTLRFLREHGAPWDVSGASAQHDMCTAAVTCGTASILEYMVEQGVQFEPGTLQKMLLHAEVTSNAGAVLWIAQQREQQRQQQQEQQRAAAGVRSS
jgi:hypothetical protein